MYVTATDLEGASSQKYVSLKVTNDYTREMREPLIESLVRNLSTILNQTQPDVKEAVKLQLQLSNLMEVGFQSPTLPLGTGVICLHDLDCGKGTCVEKECVCDPGYAGTLCQTTSSEFVLL